VVSRDRFGKKPLYYFEDKNNLVISSEIKSIFNYLKKQRVLRKSYLKSFIEFNYLSNESEETLYYDIKQFMPGVITEIKLQNIFSKKILYNNTIKNFLNYNSGLNFEDLIYDSIKIRLRSDVSTAVLVSGGIDSSVIASNAQKMNKNLIFVKGYFGEDKDNYYAKELAKNLKINLINIPINENSDAIIKRIENIIKFMETPIPIVGITIATNIIYEKISKMGIKVVLDGNGGDEIYAGYYDRYSRHFLNSCVENNEILNILKFILYKKNNGLKISTILKYLLQKIGNYFFKINFDEKIFDKTKLSLKLYNPAIKKHIFKNLEQFQLWDVEFGPTQKMLKLWDNSVMMNSVEARSPLFDYRQIYNMNKSNNQKFFKGYNKFKLRNILSSITGNKLKYRKSKQALKWNFMEEFLDKNYLVILNEIKNSNLINSCLDAKKIVDICNIDSPEFNKDKLLRLYSVAVLEKVYDCRVK